jgi:hypothetical protein
MSAGKGSFGTPTPRAGSGTAEEFGRAFEMWQAYRRLEVLFYFSRKPFYPEDQEMEQIRKVNAFRQSLRDKGVFSREYDGVSGGCNPVPNHQPAAESKTAPPNRAIL